MSSEEDLKLKKKRITININEIYSKLINNLIGILGESKSSVIYYIIKEWVSLNTEKIRRDWEVDLAEIREEYFSINFGLKVKETLNKLEIDIIKELANMSKGFERIPVKDLAKTIEVKPRIIRKLVLLNQIELENEGIHFFIEKDLIVNKDFERS